ncbi:MAG TPA: glutamate cyclase domain-containing protein, partial [Thermomicrobiales bacterium]|nr:glutamate cyclase domain-containing protein [Thermomicrobiales bacterium]
IYHNARGVDFGMGRARIDYVFDEARRRGIPTVAVGDGGNEIGMGLIPAAIRRHVPFGDRCACGCGGGIGAVTAADVLVTAAVSNWGCYAIVACLAALLGRPDLLHTPEREEALLRRGVELGLINSPAGRVDPDVDAIPLACHVAVTTLLHELGLRLMA